MLTRRMAMHRCRIFAAAAVLGGVLLSGDASAQAERVDPLASRHRDYESPQHFAFEVRASPFTPEIDSDPALGGKTPYATFFGTSPRPYIGVEFDWQALHIPHFGSLGPGLLAGYAPASAQALFAQEHNGTLVSGETTSLDIYPFSAVAVLRVDVLWREVGIPLVPYVKGGFSYALWRASNTLGTSTFHGVSGTGATGGTFLAAGVGFNLNVFDKYAAQNFDDAMGINATYIFAEGTRENLTGLGSQTEPLRVGGTHWTFGLTFEF